MIKADILVGELLIEKDNAEKALNELETER